MERSPNYIKNLDSTTIDLSCILKSDTSQQRYIVPNAASRLSAESNIKSIRQAIDYIYEKVDSGDINQFIPDSSQLLSIASSFENRLSLIQGPPGTGKSFVGNKIIQLLLTMDPPLPGPILVMSYKNQILDHMLESCLDFVGGKNDGIPKIIRIGGRSQNEKLENCSLLKIKHEVLRRYNGFRSRGFREIETTLQSLGFVTLQNEEQSYNDLIMVNILVSLLFFVFVLSFDFLFKLYETLYIYINIIANILYILFSSRYLSQH